MERKIWITQWLCPNRHASIAILWDPAKTDAAAAEAQGEAVYETGAVNRWCALCGEGLAPEARRTIYPTMADAEAGAGLEELKNLETRAAIDALKEGNKN